MAKLTHNSYGKSNIRLTKVTRRGEHHVLKELSVDIQLEGDFEKCYTAGDNCTVVPTDTMKNTVYAIARNHSIESIEDYGIVLAKHFIDGFEHISSASVSIAEVPWARITVAGKPHDHSFVGGNCERRTCVITNSRDRTTVESGIDRLMVLKTTQSGFVGYIKDRFTTLKETTERIFATSVTANWKYNSNKHDWNRCCDSIRNSLLEMFATHDSLGVQQTLYAMGEAALASCDAIDQITLVMPNQHRLLVNLQPFGIDNPNEIFVPTDEPFGLISGTISRR